MALGLASKGVQRGGVPPLTWLRRGRISLESLIGDHLLLARIVPSTESSIKSLAHCRVGGEFVIGKDGATGSL